MAGDGAAIFRSGVAANPVGARPIPQHARPIRPAWLSR
jgi:hypothetical protein